MNAATLEPVSGSTKNLAHALLRGARLRGKNLAGACLVGADLRGADLRDANLTHADLADVEATHADLRGADLTHADLTRANLRGADLRGADLTGAWLTGASPYLIQSLVAHGSRVDVRNELARLRRGGLGADLTGARVDASTVWPEGFDPVGSGVLIRYR